MDNGVSEDDMRPPRQPDQLAPAPYQPGVGGRRLWGVTADGLRVLLRPRPDTEEAAGPAVSIGREGPHRLHRRSRMVRESRLRTAAVRNVDLV